jgi:hypothetical protein
MEEKPEELTAFSGKCYSKIRADYLIKAGEQLYSCVYSDFGSWRPAADYRTADRIMKFASQKLFDERSEAETFADGLVDELMQLVGVSKLRQG